MFRRLFRSRRVREERPTWWLDAEQGCPFQLVGKDNAAGPDDVAAYQTPTAVEHRCSATTVDDYVGVPWVGRLVPEWPVPEQSFQNREEDLSIASSVESIWTRRRRRWTGAGDRSGSDSRRGSEPGLSPSGEAGPSARPAGLRDRHLRDQYPRDAVMAKLGLQVTSLDSTSPMSKCYPGRKAVFSAERSLSMYRDLCEASGATDTNICPSPLGRNWCAPTTPEAGPGSGDHERSLSPGTDERKIGPRDSKKDNSLEPNGTDGSSFTVLPAETSCPSVGGSACRHLEALLQRHRSKGSKEEVGTGFAKAGRGRNASEQSGDITLDSIEVIHGRLRSMASCRNRGTSIEDRRRKMGHGDFEHLGDTINTDPSGFGPPTHSLVTGSGDCREQGGSNMPLATSSPIPLRDGGVDVTTKGAAVDLWLDEDMDGAINFNEAGAFYDDSLGSEVTLMAQSWRNVHETDLESQRMNGAALDTLDAKGDVDPAEGALAEADFFSGVRLDQNVSSTPITIHKKTLTAPCVNHGSQWADFDVFEPQTGAKYFGMFEASSAPTGVERKSSSMSGEVHESLSTGFASTRLYTPSASCPPLSMQSALIPPVYNEEPQLSCPSVSSSVDSHISVSSYCSFVTVGSYDDDAALINLTSCLASNKTELTTAQVETTSVAFIERPLSQLSFPSFRGRAPSTCETKRGGDGSVSGAEHDPKNEENGETLCDAGSANSAAYTRCQVNDEMRSYSCITNACHVDVVSKDGALRRAESSNTYSEKAAETVDTLPLESSTSNTSCRKMGSDASSPHAESPTTSSSHVEGGERAGLTKSPTGNIDLDGSGSEDGAASHKSPKRNTSRASVTSEESTCACALSARNNSRVQSDTEGELIYRSKSPIRTSKRAETVSEGGGSCGAKSQTRNPDLDGGSSENSSSRSVSPSRDSIRGESGSEDGGSRHSKSPRKNSSPMKSVSEGAISCRLKSMTGSNTFKEEGSEGGRSARSRLTTNGSSSGESGSEEEVSSCSPTTNNRADAISEDKCSSESRSPTTKSCSEAVSEDESCRPKSPTSPFGETSPSASHSPVAAPLPVPPTTPVSSHSGGLGSSPFPSQDYQSCRDFLRKLTASKSDLSYSLSPSFVSFNGSMFPPSPSLNDCGDVFSSYTEKCLELDPQLLKELPVLPRSSATEMFTCPELRPLRLGKESSKDVFTPPSHRPLGQRLKRSGAPMAAASDTVASAAKAAEKRTNTASAASASMPELSPRLNESKVSGTRNHSRKAIA